MNEGESTDGENHVAAGRRGEEAALRFLEHKGYRLYQRNYRHGRGEIDLVMQDPAGVLVFVEVKSNRGHGKGAPLERVDGRKIRRIQKVAQRFCWERRWLDRDMRFDVVGVDLAPPGAAAQGAGVDHIENAFLPDTAGYY